MKNPYAQDSLEGRAFERALNLPEISGERWSFDEIVSTGVLPSRDGTSSDYPTEFIVDWFGVCGVSVTENLAADFSRNLSAATNRLFVVGCFEDILRASALNSRSKRGATVSLKKALRDVAEAATSLSSSMKQIRGELLYRRARGQRDSDVEVLHAGLHESFYLGQWFRAWLLSGSNGNLSLLQEDQIGSRATLSPTWLEEGLAMVADRATRAARYETSKLSAVEGNPVADAYQAFVQAAGLTWERATNQPPTARGDRASSPFQEYLRQVCGHAAGLVPQFLAAWPGAAETVNGGTEGFARRLKLTRLPGATQLRSIVQRTGEPPA